MPASTTAEGDDTGLRRVLRLHDEDAADPDRAGAKAAALARATVAGLPVLPGFVVTTVAVAAADQGASDLVDADVKAAWEEFGRDNAPLAVRSSSPAEDLGSSSMAGRFESVVGVQGWADFVGALQTVVASRRDAAQGSDIDPTAPMAVLVQPVVDAACGGVLFGVDPVTGREDRLVVTVAAGGPDPVVSGEVQGSSYELDGDGAVHAVEEGAGGVDLDESQRRALVDVAARAAEAFGGPQDVEFAFDTDGKLWLLQSRPVTTATAGVPVGPVLGPGPVAETFPEPLAPLEEDLWVEPLRTAARHVLALAGAAAPSRIDASPVVVCVNGRVAVDLELFGEATPDGGVLARLDPRPRLRRVRLAWRLGRLRNALPRLAGDLLDRVDAELLAVGELEELTTRQLVALLDRTADGLAAVHGHEMLVGLLLTPSAASLTGASVALRLLCEMREASLPDDEIVARYPAVLAVSPPRIAPHPKLPRRVEAPEWTPPEEDEAATLREALRLRVRWLQELSGRAAWEIGRRLAEDGVLDDPGQIRACPQQDLAMLLEGTPVSRPAGASPDQSAGGLPARFRLSDRGKVIPVRTGGGDHGSGAGGGRASGPVHHVGDGDPPPGAVLVVSSLDPALAPVLPRLAGLVAEVGSVLSHLAILAREADVATVVSVPNAVSRFRPGTTVTVDGTTGEVTETKEATA